MTSESRPAAERSMAELINRRRLFEGYLRIATLLALIAAGSALLYWGLFPSLRVAEALGRYEWSPEGGEADPADAGVRLAPDGKSPAAEAAAPKPAAAGPDLRAKTAGSGPARRTLANARVSWPQVVQSALILGVEGALLAICVWGALAVCREG